MQKCMMSLQHCYWNIFYHFLLHILVFLLSEMTSMWNPKLGSMALVLALLISGSTAQVVQIGR